MFPGVSGSENNHRNAGISPIQIPMIGQEQEAAQQLSTTRRTPFKDLAGNNGVDTPFETKVLEMADHGRLNCPAFAA